MVGNNSKESFTNFIQTGEKEYNIGEMKGGEGGGEEVHVWGVCVYVMEEEYK